jgi:hypothetical protein
MADDLCAESLHGLASIEHINPLKQALNAGLTHAQSAQNERPV